jgi:hypothetical protein
MKGGWIRAKHVEILALNPPYQQEWEPPDYNVVLNSPEQWLFIVEASTG